MIVYKTKTSLIIKLLFTVVLICLLVFAALEKSVALVIITLVFTAVVLYIFRTTHYTVFEHRLIIKSGFLFYEEIDIESIKRITRKRSNLLSGPGFSVDRLIIEYGDDGCVIISPKLQKEFVEHLKSIHPDIIIV
ncbi:hypothetical protein PIECOFPK_01950 [Mycovorax composti]|mgnify:FL=1|jgi:Protein of unknown function (DUF1200).|uniref:Uncharacterized protein YyaB-like PH domain-containing protein n=2 Tax=Chitinophagaceae TaxID=563835 RepID=A0ABZ2EL73_9BACT